MTCSNGVALTSTGYWAFTETTNTNKGPQVTIEAVQCPPGYCVSGQSVTGQQCAPNRVQSPSNLMCGECQANYAEV